MEIIKKKYTGVGSRKAPENILIKITKLSSILDNSGFFLRTGDARGSDNAFLKGVKHEKNKKVYDKNYYKRINKELWKKACEIALNNHPYPENASNYLNLLGRNSFQVLGDNLNDPSDFLICWTKDSKLIGGTGTTMRIANSYNIPIFNLDKYSLKQICNKIKEIYNKKY